MEQNSYDYNRTIFSLCQRKAEYITRQTTGRWSRQSKHEIVPWGQNEGQSGDPDSSFFRVRSQSRRSARERSRLSPLWEVISKKSLAERSRAFVFGDSVVNIAKEPAEALQWARALRKSSVRVWPSRPCQERRDRTGDEGERDEDRVGRRDGRGKGAKKAGAGTGGGGGKAREKCVGIEPCGWPTGPRNIALRKCASTYTHTHTHKHT